MRRWGVLMILTCTVIEGAHVTRDIPAGIAGDRTKEEESPERGLRFLDFWARALRIYASYKRTQVRGWREEESRG